ncbi:MAG TPA: hypothetical protein VKV21_03775 [Solirubrobacteraceae bacterium]|nr:hypothetical protein [Solirubrobacteraceae bacterium]
MFDLTTILTLLAPAVVAPFGCLAILKALARAEARREARPPARVEVVPGGAVAPTPVEVVPGGAVAPTPVEVVIERAATPAAEAARHRQVA